MSNDVSLRHVAEADLPIFFEHQLNPDANRMADFPARNWEAFSAHWRRILADDTVLLRTIQWNGRVAGNIGSWEQSGERLVGYWIGKEYWGKGIATRALSQFVDEVKTRPLYAHVAKHNIASIRVLEKCGFAMDGEAAGVPGPGGESIGEFILMLA
jgi:RimJ/RimL family protein N-acetyltransferase